MRVAQVYRDHFSEVPGGIERHVRDLATGIVHLGISEVIASARGPRARSFVDEGVRVHLAAEFGRPGGIALCPALPRLIGRGDYDVVHLHSPNPTGELAALSLLRKPALVATYHADIVRGAAFFGAYRKLLARLYERAVAVIATSQRLVETSPVLSELAVRRPESIHVVPLGVDVERFKPTDGRHGDRLRDSWGGGPTVLFVGRLRYYKGLDDLIAAMQHVDARLVIAGDGPERDRLLSLAAPLGDRLTFLGHVSESDLPDVYRACDVFCLPSTSRAEAFGIAAVEAMATGLPIVTTDIGTATSLVNVDSTTGFVVPPRDRGALADALGRLLGDEVLRKSMGEAARDRAGREFATAAMVSAITDIYSMCVSR